MTRLLSILFGVFRFDFNTPGGSGGLIGIGATANEITLQGHK
jgi:hypothetical protein